MGLFTEYAEEANRVVLEMMEKDGSLGEDQAHTIRVVRVRDPMGVFEEQPQRNPNLITRHAIYASSAKDEDWKSYSKARLWRASNPVPKDQPRHYTPHAETLRPPDWGYAETSGNSDTAGTALP